MVIMHPHGLVQSLDISGGILFTTIIQASTTITHCIWCEEYHFTEIIMDPRLDLFDWRACMLRVTRYAWTNCRDITT